MLRARHAQRVIHAQRARESIQRMRGAIGAMVQRARYAVITAIRARRAASTAQSRARRGCRCRADMPCGARGALRVHARCGARA